VTPERWRQIKAIFQSATDLPPADRDAWLDTQTTGDPELRREVEKMLRHAGNTGWLDRPAWQGLRMEAELEPGTHLGPYEILQQVGAGGMGRVYKARDTRLGRTVAIKVLSAEFSHRLHFEGRAVSALNHPHVCALYDIGDQDGAAYLVMEFVEGESLAACLARGPLPVDAVLRHGAEIAGALAAAHAHGIVHRDLKPANIMITPSGAKVLDFGVARIAQEEEPSTGAVVGTAAYMSPSQLIGSPADARTDIFALGLILCEMVTGTRPSRESTRPLENIPAGLAALIDRCLQEDSARRIQSMDQLRLALERLRSEPARAPVRRWAKPACIAAGVAIVAARALLTWNGAATRTPEQWPQPLAQYSSPARSFMPATPPAIPAEAAQSAAPQPAARQRPPVIRVAARTPEPPTLGTLASYPGMERDPSFSPDGSKVAFAWQRVARGGFGIYVRPVKGDDLPTALTDTPYEDWGPAWSPDGRRIAFRRRGPTGFGIYWVSASGGPETLVSHLAKPDQETLPQMSWSHDGKWIAAPDRDPDGRNHLYLFAVSSAEKRALTSNQSGIDHAPAFSPTGKSLAYASCQSGLSGCDVYVVDLTRSLEPKQQLRITDRGVYLRGLAWAPDGQSLIYSAGATRSANTSLYRVSINPPGIPQRIDMAGSDARHPTISPSHELLAYTRLNNWKLMMIRNFR
jgi:Tol biopolymer transport system component/tRNA A-37 threonylcarbamoyl transferase component Bud32